MKKFNAFLLFILFDSIGLIVTEHARTVKNSVKPPDDVHAKWVEPMKTEKNGTPKPKSSGVISDTKEETVENIAEKLNEATLNSIQHDRHAENVDFTKPTSTGKTANVYSKVKRQSKRKAMRKLSDGPTLTADDITEVLVKTEEFLIKEYKPCQAKKAKSTKEDFDKCIKNAQALAEKSFENLLKTNKKCAGAKLQECKVITWKKVLGYVPFNLPVSLTLSSVTATDYGGHKIGFILAKHFDTCYENNDKIDMFLKCLQNGNEKSPLNVARDEIAVLVGDFCENKATDEKECRGNVVNYIKLQLDEAAEDIMEIFCTNKDKSTSCGSAKTSARDEVSKDFDIFSKHSAIPLNTFKTEPKYGEVDVGTELGKAADKCKKQQTIDKFIGCLKGELDSAVKKTIANKLAFFCKSKPSTEKDCRKKGEGMVEGKLKGAVSAVLTNYCGGSYKKEKAYQSCLKSNGNKISMDIQLPAPTISFEKPTPLNSIVTEDVFGKITIGSILEVKLKDCLEKSKGKKTDDFTNCLGSLQTDPLKTSMNEILNQLTSHCAKEQLKEGTCRKEGEEIVQDLIKSAIDSLILEFCEGESTKYKWQIDYDECHRTSKASELSGEFILPFKLLDEISLSNFIKGGIMIGEILKKEAESCKTANSQTRDEYFNCMKGKHLQTVKADIAKQLADSCGKVERGKVRDCRENGKNEVEKKLKDSLTAILMNFCREFKAKPEDEYNDCLNFDGTELDTEAKIGELPATVQALIDVLQIMTDKDNGEIKIGEILHTETNACNDKKTSNEYFKCLKGDDGTQSSPLKTAIEKVKKEFADVCGQKESIRDCRAGKPLLNTKDKLKEATDAIFLNYCGQKAGNTQQEYTKCVDDGFKETLPFLNDKTLPISLRKEISLPSLVIIKYGNIPAGEILQGQTRTCKKSNTFDEAITCLKTSNDAEPSPLKSAKDSISDEFADFALKQNLGDNDWNQGVEEVKKEFKKTVQAFLSNFCRENVNKNQKEYLSCLIEGLKSSETLSQGYTPIDIFLQCSSKKTESDYNKCIDTVNGQRLNSWTIACSSDSTLGKECTDAATKMASESAQVAKVAAKLVACVRASCIKTEKPKVIDAFVKAVEKHCKTPCKDSKIKVDSALKKGVTDCSADQINVKCRADFLSTVNMTSCEDVSHIDACEEMCAAGMNENDKVPVIFCTVVSAIVILSIPLLVLGSILIKDCFSKKGSGNPEDPSSEPLLKKQTIQTTSPSSPIAPPPSLPPALPSRDLTPEPKPSTHQKIDQDEGENINKQPIVDEHVQNNNPNEIEEAEPVVAVVNSQENRVGSRDGLRRRRRSSSSDSATVGNNKEHRRRSRDGVNRRHSANFVEAGPICLPYRSFLPDPASVVRPRSVKSLRGVIIDKTISRFINIGKGYDCVETAEQFEDRCPGELSKEDEEECSDTIAKNNDSGTGPSTPGAGSSKRVPARRLPSRGRPELRRAEFAHVSSSGESSGSKSRESSAEPSASKSSSTGLLANKQAETRSSRTMTRNTKRSSASPSVPTETQPSTSGLPSVSALSSQNNKDPSRIPKQNSRNNSKN